MSEGSRVMRVLGSGPTLSLDGRTNVLLEIHLLARCHEPLPQWNYDTEVQLKQKEITNIYCSRDLDEYSVRRMRLVKLPGLQHDLIFQ